MGWDVDHFDHFKIGAEEGLDRCGDRFLQAAVKGNYDLILYQTAGCDRMNRGALKEVASKSLLVAWNSDDDWQWDSYTSKIIGYFTYMVTTYRSIYERAQPTNPNLLLSQWACYPAFSDHTQDRSIPISFGGYVYGARVDECRILSDAVGLRAFGFGSGRVRYRIPALRGLARVPAVFGRPMSFPEINSVWNSSSISYTPMGASTDPKVLQIKSRTFEMGLSGTLMLCNSSPNLEEFYTPGQECVTFSSMEDCCEKIRFYLKNDSARLRISNAYRIRTLRCHLWTTRMSQLLSSIGV
jgi:hypothetical protein